MFSIVPDTVFFFFFFNLFFFCRKAFCKIFELITTIMVRFLQNETHTSEEKSFHGEVYVDLTTETYHHSRYAYMTTDISSCEIEDMHMSAITQWDGERDHNRERLAYITKLLKSQQKGWPWCKKKQQCGLHMQELVCDLAVMYKLRANQKAGCGVCSIPVMLFEVHSDARYGGSSTFFHLARAMAHCMVFQPTAFAMILNEQDLSLYEFNRDPVSSYMDVKEQRIRLFNSKGQSIGDNLVNIVENIAKCILYTSMNLTQIFSPGFSNIAQRNTATCRSSGTMCNTCWHIDDIFDLDEKCEGHN